MTRNEHHLLRHLFKGSTCLARDLFCLEADVAHTAKALRAEQIEHDVRRTGMPSVDLHGFPAEGPNEFVRVTRKELQRQSCISPKYTM